jgi:hypothetical protein
MLLIYLNFLIQIAHSGVSDFISYFCNIHITKMYLKLNYDTFKS